LGARGVDGVGDVKQARRGASADQWRRCGPSVSWAEPASRLFGQPFPTFASVSVVLTMPRPSGNSSPRVRQRLVAAPLPASLREAVIENPHAQSAHRIATNSPRMRVSTPTAAGAVVARGLDPGARANGTVASTERVCSQRRQL
jgi:hypothetical protein